MKKVLKATGNLVIIEQKTIEMTDSGIVLADSAMIGGSMEMFEGTILAIGPSVTKFKKGDHVIFGRNVFATHKRQGKEYLMIYEPNLNCVEKLVEDNYEVEDSELVLEGGF